MELYLLNSYLMKMGTYVEFLQRYNIPIIPKEYCIVFDAITSGLKCLFKGNVNNDNVRLRLKE